MSCKSIFVNLGGGGGGSVNTGVLQIAGGVALDSTLRFVEDQNGTDSIIKVSTLESEMRFDANTAIRFASLGANTPAMFPNNLTAANTWFFAHDGNNYYLNSIATGFFRRQGTDYGAYNSNGWWFGAVPTQNGAVTIRGLGGNIASFRDSSNVERASIDNSGQINAINFIGSGVGIWDGTNLYRAVDTESIGVFNGGGAAAGFIVYGSANATTFLRNKILVKTSFIGLGEINSATAPAIKRNAENIDFRLSNDTGYCGITAGRSTEKTLEVLEVSGAMGLGFFNTPAINQPTQAIAEATYVSGGGGGSSVHTNDTFGNYTIGQVVQALLDLGLLG